MAEIIDGPKLHFEESYFEGETRDGFYIEPMMKRAWAAQLEVLADLQEIFEKYHIEYFADWGTLLGAVRHKGFIPWDDDIDIVMKRKDWTKFLEVAKNELPKGYKLYYADLNEATEMTFGRVTSGARICFEETFLKKFHGCPYSVGIDIFILDVLPEDEEERDIYFAWAELLNGLLTLCMNKKEHEVLDRLDEVEEFFGIKVHRDKPILSQLSRLFDRISQMYYGEKGAEITEIPYWAQKKELILKKEWYDGYTLEAFENVFLPVPKGYDEILRILYGEDYMTPIRGVADHEYPFYRKQELLVEKWIEQEEQKRKNGI